MNMNITNTYSIQSYGTSYDGLAHLDPYEDADEIAFMLWDGTSYFENFNHGVLYIVYSDFTKGVKIGYWRSHLKSLVKRYVTCYGQDLTFIIFKTRDCRTLEKITKYLFVPHNISHELYKKSALEHYKIYTTKRHTWIIISRTSRFR